MIIIETSGSSHPMPLVEYFKEHNTFKLTGVLALVDSLMLAHDYNYGESLIPKMQDNLAKDVRGTVNLLVEQILFCSHLILTKADRIKEDKLHILHRIFRKLTHTLHRILSFLENFNLNPYLKFKSTTILK